MLAIDRYRTSPSAATLAAAANAFARQNGRGRATDITLVHHLPAGQMAIGATTAYGYRKSSTGEYVPNAYMRKFGWKNCYYQSAQCEILVGVNETC